MRSFSASEALKAMRVGPTKPTIRLDSAVVGATGGPPASPDRFPIAVATLLLAMTLPPLGCQQIRRHAAQGVPSNYQVRPSPRSQQGQRSLDHRAHRRSPALTQQMRRTSPASGRSAAEFLGLSAHELHLN